MERYAYVALALCALWLLREIRDHLANIRADIRTIYYDLQYHAPTPWNVISIVKERQKDEDERDRALRG
jgi:hypothetical protein